MNLRLKGLEAIETLLVPNLFEKTHGQKLAVKRPVKIEKMNLKQRFPSLHGGANADIAHPTIRTIEPLHHHRKDPA
jgi:hypothetical protein